ncbi:hypothetical protein BGZ82_001182, partial [Podila clonocystis]
GLRPSVKATTTDIGDDMKRLIKAEKTNDFSDVDADEPTLWRVYISDNDDDDKKQRVLLDNVPDRKKIKATINLIKVFVTVLARS